MKKGSLTSKLRVTFFVQGESACSRKGSLPQYSEFHYDCPAPVEEGSGQPFQHPRQCE
jgi:hypothetical protein